MDQHPPAPAPECPACGWPGSPGGPCVHCHYRRGTVEGSTGPRRVISTDIAGQDAHPDAR